LMCLVVFLSILRVYFLQLRTPKKESQNESRNVVKETPRQTL